MTSNESEILHFAASSAQSDKLSKVDSLKKLRLTKERDTLENSRVKCAVRLVCRRQLISLPVIGIED